MAAGVHGECRQLQDLHQGQKDDVRAALVDVLSVGLSLNVPRTVAGVSDAVNLSAPTIPIWTLTSWSVRRPPNRRWAVRTTRADLLECISFPLSNNRLQERRAAAPAFSAPPRHDRLLGRRNSNVRRPRRSRTPDRLRGWLPSCVVSAMPTSDAREIRASGRTT